jgi:hypothetical protein
VIRPGNGGGGRRRATWAARTRAVRLFGAGGNWRRVSAAGCARDVIGHLAGKTVKAPIAGTLRGVVRDGTRLPTAVKLLEVDPRAEGAARWTGMDPRGRRIAEAVLEAAGIAAPVRTGRLTLAYSR